MLRSPAAGCISGTEKPLSAHSSNIPGRRKVGLGGRQERRDRENGVYGFKSSGAAGRFIFRRILPSHQLCEEELQHEPFTTDAQRSVISDWE